MSSFNFINKKTKKITIFNGTIAEATAHEKKNPQLEWMPSAVGFHSGLGLKKPDSNFRDLLKNIKKANSKGFSKSTVNDFGGGNDF